MTLNPHPQYPSTRSYVLKLRRDTDPHAGAFSGRLENMASGQCFEFHSGEELLACLALDAVSCAIEALISTRDDEDKQ